MEIVDESQYVRVAEPTYEIIGNLDGNEIIKKLEMVARTCYKSENNINDGSAERFIGAIIKSGHTAMLEHENITVKFYCNRGFCYTPDTKVMTETGWKYFDDVTYNDLVYTLTDDGEVVLSPIKSKIEQNYNGKIYNFYTTQIDLSVTGNHNMWVYDYNKRSEKTKTWKFIQAKDMNNNRYMFDKRGIINNINIENDEYITIPEYYKKHVNLLLSPEQHFNKRYFYELLGLWITDGYLEKRDNGNTCGRVCITQKKKDICDRIDYLLKMLDIKYSKHNINYRINNPGLYSWIKNNFILNNNYKKSYYCFVPNFIKLEQPHNIKYFIDGVFEGDGSIMEDGRKLLYSASKQFMEDVQFCLFKIGVSSNWYPSKRYKERTDERKIFNKVPTYVLSVVKNKHLYNKNDSTYEVNDYCGKVVCLELENYHRLYVMKNGKACWSGNSHEMVRHRHCGFAQESSRYCSYEKDKFGNKVTVIMPSQFKKGTNEYILWLNAMDNSAQAYFNLKNLCNVKNDMARGVLPIDLKTELNVTASIREWRAIFGLRCANDAHPSMRQLMIPLLKDLHSRIPIVFDDLFEKFCKEG